MRNLSKSKLLAFRQCPKRLWLELNRPDLREDSTSAQAAFAVGNRVGEIARHLYDPGGLGQVIDVKNEGVDGALARSRNLLADGRPIFEAGFAADGALAFADVLLPGAEAGQGGWRMIEVKSSTEVKDYHRADVAIQAFVAKRSGVSLQSIAVAHIDSRWVYQGDGDYSGLLVEKDLTDEAFARDVEVEGWITAAQAIADMSDEPTKTSGRHCRDPYECGFLAYCKSQEPQAEYPVDCLPNVRTKALKSVIEGNPAIDLRDVPDELLNDQQRRVKAHSLSGEIFFDAPNAAADIAIHGLPARFLDFETAVFAVPLWKGMTPYQQIPFQFSIHYLSPSGALTDDAFIDLSGEDPTRAFAEALVEACGETGPVFVYNASFEMTRVRELGRRFPDLERSLLAINDRIVDLLPIVKNHYYHPIQEGSWSIKQVLPAIAPDLDYTALDGVQDGGMAMSAYEEAIAPSTTEERKREIEKQLLRYCGLDTYALVRLWKLFAGREDLPI